MKAIYTLQNADGTYDEVGMNSRSIDTQVTLRLAQARAERLADLKGKNVRLEVWADHVFYQQAIPGHRAYFTPKVLA